MGEAALVRRLRLGGAGCDLALVKQEGDVADADPVAIARVAHFEVVAAMRVVSRLVIDRCDFDRLLVEIVMCRLVDRLAGLVVDELLGRVAADNDLVADVPAERCVEVFGNCFGPGVGGQSFAAGTFGLTIFGLDNKSKLFW
jgi:hypothetical protein